MNSPREAPPIHRQGECHAKVLEVRVNEHGRTVVRTDCPRRWGGLCDVGSRPAPCLQFPASYLGDDHSDAERAEVREFCALFRRLELDEAAHDETLQVKGKVVTE